jgi:hypothetical protein
MIILYTQGLQVTQWFVWTNPPHISKHEAQQQNNKQTMKDSVRQKRGHSARHQPSIKSINYNSYRETAIPLSEKSKVLLSSNSFRAKKKPCVRLKRDFSTFGPSFYSLTPVVGHQRFLAVGNRLTWMGVRETGMPRSTSHCPAVLGFANSISYAHEFAHGFHHLHLALH